MNVEKLIMIKYGELSTKKDNIKVFIDKLNSNVSKKLADYDVSISKNKVRMFIDIKDYNEVDIISKLKEVFGIHSIVVCYKCNKSIEDINILAKELIDKENITTFKVETNRADKSFKYNSLEVSSNEKLLGILSYLGILSLIPYFCSDKSDFVKYHATQGLNLFLVSIVYYVLNHLLSLIKITKTVVSFNGVVGTGRVTPFIIRFPLLMCGIFLCIISIMGIIYVCQGEKKDLPVVKDVKIIK